MRILRCLMLLPLCLPAVALLAMADKPAFAAREADAPALRAIVAYGDSHLDAATGLVTDGSNTPDLPNSSAGYVAACLAAGQHVEQARLVLGRMLDLQQPTGPTQGHFPWKVAPGVAPSPEATLYAAPLLAYALRRHAPTLGADLSARLKQSLELAHKAISRVPAKPQDDARFLLQAAAKATIAAAVEADPGAAAGEVEDWLRHVGKNGLPAGHSPTFDAIRYVSLKWIRESLMAGAADRATVGVDRALALCAVDMAGRVHPATGYLAGAINEAFSSEYIHATGFAAYVLHTDFGLPLPVQVDPYLAAALLPEWHAPESIGAITATTGLRRTRALNAEVEATDTYVGQSYSLGTMSGRVSSATIPIFCTFTRSDRPTLYFYGDPTPCSVNSVQADNLALCSFNFDDVGIPPRIKASLNGVLGTRETIQDVICYGVPWNGQPTSVGELESVALATADCYVGITLTRTGSAGHAEGVAAKPAILNWSNPDGTGNLLLTIYARPQEYPLPQSQYNMRAGVVIEVTSQLTYPTLADFAKHLGSGRLKQSAKSGREYLPGEDKPKDPNVLIPDPQAKSRRAYRPVLTQTIEYTLEGRTLKLTEDLVHNQSQERQIDGVTLDPKYLWESEFFKWEPTGDLAAALGAFM